MSTDYETLFKWIDELPITRQKRNINRDFSDAVPLAEILKHFYPKLVDLHNYTPKNALAQKIINWETLNRKVLSKLKLTLTSDDIEQLAKSVPGAIERLLVDVKRKIEMRAEGDKTSAHNIYFFEEMDKISEGKIIPIKVKSGTKITEQKVVPSEVFDKMQADLTEKEETIKTLKLKVEHLESMLSMKNARIEELTKQLENVMNEPAKNAGSPRTRFFNRIFY